MSRGADRVKRALDLGLGLALLVAAAPLLAVLAVAIRLDSPGPALFRQERLGRGGRTFPILKLRTMVAEAGTQGAAVMTHRDDPRLTRVGRVLRRYRLDELPQLVNVVRGQMSLVGPRPLLPRFLPYYTDFDRRRLEAVPGMTGWQQVKGAARHTWKERVALDIWYVDHRGLWLDLRILLLTAGVVLKAETAYAEDGSQRSGLPDGCPEPGREP